MTDISTALVKDGITPTHLPLVPFAEWVSQLEALGEKADMKELQSIVSILTNARLLIV
jgi:hypothetical protein